MGYKIWVSTTKRRSYIGCVWSNYGKGYFGNPLAARDGEIRIEFTIFSSPVWWEISKSWDRLTTRRLAWFSRLLPVMKEELLTFLIDLCDRRWWGVIYFCRFTIHFVICSGSGRDKPGKEIVGECRQEESSDRWNRDKRDRYQGGTFSCEKRCRFRIGKHPTGSLFPPFSNLFLRLPNYLRWRNTMHWMVKPVIVADCCTKLHDFS